MRLSNEAEAAAAEGFAFEAVQFGLLEVLIVPLDDGQAHVQRQASIFEPPACVKESPGR
jgi:hypothetical protein